MPKSYQEIIDEARRLVPELTADELRRGVESNAGSIALGERDTGIVVLDVREKEEYRDGHLAGAISIPRGFLEMQVEGRVPEKQTPIVAYCQSGVRSLLAGRILKEMGYTDVRSLGGGFGAWKNGGFPWVQDRAFTREQVSRYSRHFLLDEVGETGQAKLLDARVLCLGAGGLGSPVAFYLAAAGVGTLGIVDDDVVDLSNLQRQILHTTDRVGMLKVESAAKTIKALNPDVKVIEHRTRLDSSNILDIIADYDIIVDGCDNFPTRYLVNDACVMTNKTNVHGSIFQFEGQVTVFKPGAGPCYRCLFPEPPPPGMAPSCAEAGVLGVLPGLVGSIQALETIKLILGTGTPLIGRLAHIETLGFEVRTMKLRRDPKCPMCGDHPTITGLIDYEQFCGLRPPSSSGGDRNAA